MKPLLTRKIEAPCAWRGEDLAHDQSWIHHLSPKTLAALDKALAQVCEKGLKAPNFTREDFPVPALAEEIRGFAEALENGRGFLLLRGLPADRYSEEEMAIIYYGLGLHMGQPVTQNPRAELLGIVTAVGDPGQKTTRVYETNSYLPYHTDLSDVVGLLSIRKAREGGLSSLVSAATVYNEILEKNPHYLALLYRPLYFAHLGDDLPVPSPVFSYHEGKLSCRYLRAYIELGHELSNVRLSEVEIEALDLIDSIIHDPAVRLDMMLEPGDMQFANNYAVMHSRTRFEDYDEPERKRRLLRLWLKMPNARTLAPEFPGRNGFHDHVHLAASA
ncbi:TauD/TfdA family dioxygenase [Pseudomonas lopnurensis]|uniref:TauD/TfdA family dioxygenase n=1 Tax=Pseudomonas lopnurensis TaxID=1477517 RepID=UPI0028AF6163|nr:TauD/TfdA family dioxygenase [Pseudomonas lopnurensis]